MTNSYLLLACAAFCAGLLNSVAGGGTFLTFPALVFTGVPSVAANATSTVSLLPGVFASAWAYRKDFKALGGVPIEATLGSSIAGGVTGALLLLYMSERAFEVIVPWLLLCASLVFTFGQRLMRMLERRSSIGPKALLGIQFLLGIYGGYFGGAVGILMLALWTLIGVSDIHTMNANRTLLGGSMNAAAIVLFILAGKVWWPQATVMLVAAVIGGYSGARVAKRTNPKWIRAFVSILSFTVTIVFFMRT